MASRPSAGYRGVRYPQFAFYADNNEELPNDSNLQEYNTLYQTAHGQQTLPPQGTHHYPSPAYPMQPMEYHPAFSRAEVYQPPPAHSLYEPGPQIPAFTYGPSTNGHNYVSGMSSQDPLSATSHRSAPQRLSVTEAGSPQRIPRATHSPHADNPVEPTQNSSGLPRTIQFGDHAPIFVVSRVPMSSRPTFPADPPHRRLQAGLCHLCLRPLQVPGSTPPTTPVVRASGTGGSEEIGSNGTNTTGTDNRLDSGRLSPRSRLEDRLVWCRSCGTNFHKRCIEWAVGEFRRNSRVPECPVCFFHWVSFD